MTVSLIPQEVFDVVAQDASRLLAPSVELSGGRESLDTLWYRLTHDYFQLWMFFDEDNIPEGALVTSIEQHPLKKMLNLRFIGGDNLDGWHEELLETLERYAKENGCDGMETVGRFGWKKFLGNFGWETTHIVCEKTFDVIEEENQDAA